MYIIIKEFPNFWVCFDRSFLSNIPVQVILDFGKSFLTVPGDWGIKFRKKWNIKYALNSMTIPTKC